MQETPQQYTERILGYIAGEDPMRLLAASPKEIAALVRRVPARRLSKRPAPGSWSITEILAHLADVEIVQSFRIRMILGASGTPIQGFDQDVWAAYSNYASHDPGLSLRAYLVTRERTLQLLSGLTPEMWERYGMHSERGRETVRRVSEMMAGHDINHLRRIREILKGAA